MSWVSGLDALSAGLPEGTTLPASVRNGSPAARSAYETGLGFEDMLVNQLAQEMMATSSSPSGDGASNPYSSLMGQALTSGIMSAGGVGVAQEIATALDPALAATAPATAPGARPATTPGAPPTAGPSAAPTANPASGGAGL